MSKTSEDEPLWDSDQAGKYLNLTAQTVRRLCRENRLPFVRPGDGSYRFAPARLRQWVADKTIEPVR